MTNKPITSAPVLIRNSAMSKPPRVLSISYQLPVIITGESRIRTPILNPSTK